MSTTRSRVRPAPATSETSAPQPAPWSEAGLVLLAHGSTRRDDDAVLRHAERLRRRSLFAEVTAGFVKGTPDLRAAVGVHRAQRLYLVPCFMADGYYTRRVIPDSLGLAGPISVTPEGQTLYYCAPIGTSPALAEIVRRRAVGVCRDAGMLASDTTVLLIAHGSPTAIGSFDAIRTAEDRLRWSGGFADVRTAFLEESPKVADALSELAGRDVVAVGILACEGVHAAHDIPRLIANFGGDVRYAGVIGSGPGALALALDRVRHFDRRVLGITRPSPRWREPCRVAARAT